MTFFALFMMCICSLSASDHFETEKYRTYSSHADPLYSPWLCDPEFLQINSRFHDWREHTEFRYIQYVLARTAALECKTGDFIECGVYSGKTLDICAGVLERFDHADRTILGFDSFEGVDTPGTEDLDVRTNSSMFHKGSCKYDFEHIRGRFIHRKSKIELIRGWIPNTFQGFEDYTFAFAHIDVDLYQATKDCLTFIYPRMVPGGIILFDDYGYPECAGARKAIDEFLSDKPEVLIPIPTAQAFLIKTRN